MSPSLNNPLLQDWTAPHGLPPFDALLPEHFEPAFKEAMKAHRDELRAIASQAAAPSFDNTLAAFDRAGRQLSRVASVFYNLTAFNTSPALQAVQRHIRPVHRERARLALERGAPAEPA